MVKYEVNAAYVTIPGDIPGTHKENKRSLRHFSHQPVGSLRKL